MSPRYFRFGIICVQIDVGKDATICIPAADIRSGSAQGKLLTRRVAPFDYQFGVDFGVGGHYFSWRLPRRDDRPTSRLRHSQRGFPISPAVRAVALLVGSRN